MYAPRERRCVVVDDSHLTRAWSARVLRAGGGLVQVAGDDDTAMRLVADQDPHVVLVTERRVQVGGCGLASALRAGGATAGIVIVGDRDDQDLESDALQAGADHVVRRPCTERDLERAVSAAESRGADRRARRAREHELDGEVRAAAMIQSALHPVEPELPEGWVLETAFLPARDVGGDLYDLIPRPGPTLVMALADVSGKGVGAALLAAMAQTALRAAVARGDHPARALAAANDLLIEPLERAGRFLTAFVAHVDLRTGRFVYADAGHGHQLVVDAAGQVTTLDVGGPPLGLLGGTTFPLGEGVLPVGGVLTSYSDGLVEGDGEPEDRRADLAQALAGGALAARLVADAPDDDDRTMVVLRRLR